MVLGLQQVLNYAQNCFGIMISQDYNRARNILIILKFKKK